LAVAIDQVRAMAFMLRLDSDQVQKKLINWLVPNEAPDVPTVADLHCWAVHAFDETWIGIARIDVRCASIATSKADLEQFVLRSEERQ
jgi:hypothetical protein